MTGTILCAVLAGLIVWFISMAVAPLHDFRDEDEPRIDGAESANDWHEDGLRRDEVTEHELRSAKDGF